MNVIDSDVAMSDGLKDRLHLGPFLLALGYVVTTQL